MLVNVEWIKGDSSWLQTDWKVENDRDVTKCTDAVNTATPEKQAWDETEWCQCTCSIAFVVK